MSQPLQVTPSIQNGTVGPGLWRVVGGEHCSWSQNGPYKGNWRGGDAFDLHDVQHGPVYAEVVPAVGSFQASGVGRSGSPAVRDLPLATPGQPFGPGDFRVGVPSSAPGTYTAPGWKLEPPYLSCTWACVRNFTFGANTIIASGARSPTSR